MPLPDDVINKCPLVSLVQYKAEATSPLLASTMRPLLLAASAGRILFTLAHYRLVAALVRSKPPGRKMVKLSITVCHNATYS